MAIVLKILRFCSNGHIGGLTVQTGFKMANTRQAYMLIVCVCVTKSTRERTAKALPLAHHECMLNAWKNGKVERFRYVKITSISPKLSPFFCTGLLFCTFYVILICLVCLVIVFSWICLEEIRQEVFGIIWFIQFVSHFPSTYSP